MPESQIYYLGELVERKLDEVLQSTEFSLINYIGLTPEGPTGRSVWHYKI